MERINKKMVVILAINPFKEFDLKFASATANSNVFPLVKVNHTNNQFEKKIHEFSNKLSIDFGILIEGSARFTTQLPANVKLVIVDPEADVSVLKSTKCIYQINSVEQAKEAVKRNAYGIVIKGNESAGKVGKETSLILFQHIMKTVKIPIWVRGGIGIHSSAAFIGLGAKGVLLDYQLCCFPEMAIDNHTKNLIRRLEGTDTKVVHSYRFYESPGIEKTTNKMTINEFTLKLDSLLEKGAILPLSQDIGLANYFFNKYKKLSVFISAFFNSISGHIRQAQNYKPLISGNSLCQELGIKHPFIQGPMTRVSDNPVFANEIAKEGALPFIALSLLHGAPLKNLLTDTQKLVDKKKWGVGLLGFAPKEIWEEQCKLINEIKPNAVIIAGGRSSQARYFEQNGIKAYLHVPTEPLLDIYLKEGVKRFVFEGRESGGHVGPLTSLVLWERQIERLLKEEKTDDISVLFAGGIANPLSMAIISIMCAPLAAKGTKVGVVLGSAYLFTKEAVETGAILQQFQDMLLKCNETVLVESGNGYVTRCLNTPFVNFFNKQKQKLLNSGQDSQKVKQYLEKLNVGRLRIASKGIDRKGDKLVKISQQVQHNEGMFMIGQVTSLLHKTTSINELHNELLQGGDELINNLVSPKITISNNKPLDIAIIGMACIFPGAKDLDEYWRNIVTGKNSITEVPDERWDKEFFYDPKATGGDKTPSKQGGFIPAIKFNPLEFGIIPNSMQSIDPAQLLSLYVANKALEDAGYHKREFDRENTSVIFGADSGGSQLSSMYNFKNTFFQFFDHMPEDLEKQLPEITEDSFPGILANVISGRIANRLDLGGYNFTVDAACASSLASLDVACSLLTSGKSNMVLAGGVDLHNNISNYLMFASSHILSKKEKYSVFDENSDGIILGEGVAVVVLKRLEDAIKDGDRIYSVIKGLGSSSDGKSLGLTAPNKRGQYRAFARAYHQAGINPSEINIIETHGTGTTIGDHAELSSMTNFFYENGAIKNQIHISSVKPQIGHTKCAAGLAGLIKTSLCVYHSIIPPIINLTQPNKFYNKKLSLFSFNNQTSVWMSDERKAGVSSFGFGGTNFHTVIENYAEGKNENNVLKAWPSELYVFRGDDLGEASIVLKNVQSLLTLNQDIKPNNLAYSLFQGSKKIQVAIVADDIKNLQRKIDNALNSVSSEGVYFFKPLDGEIAFLFSGQGSQRLGMARDMFINFPFLRNYLKLKPEVEKIVFPSAAFDDISKKEQEEEIKDTRNAQPLLGIFDYAIANFLKELGIKPDTLAGHSYGEIPALCFAGVFDEENLVSLSEDRALSITQSTGSDPGIMIAVSCEESRLIEIIKDYGKVYLANHNAPNQMVVSGATQAMKEFSLELKKQNIPYKQLNVACAFHSPLLVKSQEYFSKALEKYDFEKMKIPVWSNTTAGLYPTGPQAIKHRLSEHLIKPVLFGEEIKKMYQNGVRIFIEVGPGKILTQLAGNILNKECLLLNTEQKNSNGITCLLNALAQYIVSGKEIKYEKLFENRNACLINIESSESYAYSPSLWNVNGYKAYPVSGKMSVIKKVKSPVIESKVSSELVKNNMNNTNEKLVYEYLKNIRTLVQSQHEIVMSCLGAKQNTIRFNDNFFPAAKTHNGNNTTFKVIEDDDRLKNSAREIKTEQIFSFGSIKESFLNIVHEKTGYPFEMLELDMDLEADLSIDSIKRIELISSLKELFSKSFTFPDTGIDNTEQLSTIKTLRGLVEWFYDKAKLQSSKNRLSKSPNGKKVLVENRPEQVNVKEKLLTIISEKTGYPQEMLSMDMDLEADLSIDSIKRVEIVSNIKDYLPDIFSQENSDFNNDENLASIKTLKGWIEWLEKRSSHNIVPVHESIKNDFQNLTVKSDALSPEKVKSTLLKTISEKTGYPEEMLGMGMDLEADLSIDSIKRMEIIDNLRNHFKALQNYNGEKDDVVERLASIKTLNGLAEWIINSIPAGDPYFAANDTEVVKEKKEESSLKLQRITIECVPTILNKNNEIPLSGKKLGIAGYDSTKAHIITDKLKQLGIAPNVVSDKDNLEQHDGLIFFDLTSNYNKQSINSLFSIIKKLDNSKARWVYIFTDYKSQVSQNNNIESLYRIQGYPGFLKSLDKEWNTKCRIVHIDNGIPDKDIAEIVAEELLSDDVSTEIYYKESKRHTPKLTETTLVKDKSSFDLPPNSVILVFGGAQGITSEIVIKMAKEYPCHYILVGRTIWESAEGDIAYRSILDKDIIRKKLLSTRKFNTPKELENYVNKQYKQNQIEYTIDAVREKGGNATYLSADLTDNQSLKNLFEEIHRKYDRIDGVIHAAGYLSDKLLINKTKSMFDQVYNTKVNPLRFLHKIINPDLKFLVFFSSISSVLGNKGQVDYSAANSVMDDYAFELQRILNIKSIAINWGPWNGKGMVSKELENDFLRRGLASIPIKEGVKAFMDELKFGHENQVIIIAPVTKK